MCVVCRVCVVFACFRSAEEVDDTFPTLVQVWARLGDEDQLFRSSINNYPAATLEPLLRAGAHDTHTRYHTRTHFINALAQNGTLLVQRMQFHLQKPCAVRVGSELDYVAFADIQRVLPRITLGTGTPQLYVYMHYVYMC